MQFVGPRKAGMGIAVPAAFPALAFADVIGIILCKPVVQEGAMHKLISMPITRLADVPPARQTNQSKHPTPFSNHLSEAPTTRFGKGMEF